MNSDDNKTKQSYAAKLKKHTDALLFVGSLCVVALLVSIPFIRPISSFAERAVEENTGSKEKDWGQSGALLELFDKDSPVRLVDRRGGQQRVSVFGRRHFVAPVKVGFEVGAGVDIAQYDLSSLRVSNGEGERVPLEEALFSELGFYSVVASVKRTDGTFEQRDLSFEIVDRPYADVVASLTDFSCELAADGLLISGEIGLTSLQDGYLGLRESTVVLHLLGEGELTGQVNASDWSFVRPGVSQYSDGSFSEFSLSSGVGSCSPDAQFSVKVQGGELVECPTVVALTGAMTSAFGTLGVLAEMPVLSQSTPSDLDDHSVPHEGPFCIALEMSEGPSESEDDDESCRWRGTWISGQPQDSSSSKLWTLADLGPNPDSLAVALFSKGAMKFQALSTSIQNINGSLGFGSAKSVGFFSHFDWGPFYWRALLQAFEVPPADAIYNFPLVDWEVEHSSDATGSYRIIMEGEDCCSGSECEISHSGKGNWTYTVDQTSTAPMGFGSTGGAMAGGYTYVKTGCSSSPPGNLITETLSGSCGLVGHWPGYSGTNIDCPFPTELPETLKGKKHVGSSASESSGGFEELDPIDCSVNSCSTQVFASTGGFVRIRAKNYYYDGSSNTHGTSHSLGVNLGFKKGGISGGGSYSYSSSSSTTTPGIGQADTTVKGSGNSTSLLTSVATSDCEDVPDKTFVIASIAVEDD